MMGVTLSVLSVSVFVKFRTRFWDKTDKADKTGKVDKTEKVDKTDKVDKTNKTKWENEDIQTVEI